MQNRVKINFLPLCLETSLAWKFLFLCSSLKNLPMIIRKKFVFQQPMSIPSWTKTKNYGVAGWKVGQTLERNNCSRAKKYNKNTETLLAKQIFPSLFETGR